MTGISIRKIVTLLLVLIFLASLWAIFAKPARSSAEVTENSWTTKATMHTARAYLGVVVVNGKIYAIGGDTGSIYGGGAYPAIIRGPPVVNTNEEYDPATDKWTTKTPMPTARAQFGTAVYQNMIYCMGGYYNNYNNTGANEVYDPATNSWYTKAPMPSPAVAVQANTVGDKIYVIGSKPNMNYVYAPVNYVYDSATDSWASKTPPPNEITDRYSAVVGSKIYFIGFLTNSSNVVETYDTLNDRWSVLTASPSYSSFSSMNGGGATSGVYAPGQICFFDDKATNVFDPANDSWTIGAPMPSDRLCAGVAVVNDTFYVIGGRSGRHDLITEMEPTAATEQYIAVGYGTIRPVVSAVSPENKTYNENSVPLAFRVDKPISWMGYSLDGQDNVSISGNITLTDLSNGVHNLTIYAKYTEGSIGASENVAFIIAEPEPEPFPATLAITASGASAAIIGVSLLVYFKKRKRKADPS